MRNICTGQEIFVHIRLSFSREQVLVKEKSILNKLQVYMFIIRYLKAATGGKVITQWPVLRNAAPDFTHWGVTCNLLLSATQLENMETGLSWFCTRRDSTVERYREAPDWLCWLTVVVVHIFPDLIFLSAKSDNLHQSLTAL